MAEEMTTGLFDGIHHASADVVLERYRQFEKWGPQNHSWGKWSMILAEETGELWKEILEGRVTEVILSEAATAKAYQEAIQVAAVALAIAQQLKTGQPV